MLEYKRRGGRLELQLTGRTALSSLRCSLRSSQGTNNEMLTISGIIFLSGQAENGGGLRVGLGAAHVDFGSPTIVDIVFCSFTSCRATHASTYGGGGISVSDVGTVVRVYSSSFSSNVADSSNGNDVFG